MKTHTVGLLEGQELTVVSDAFTSGHVVRNSQSAGGEPQSPTVMGVSSSVKFGPYVGKESFTLQSDIGELTYSKVNTVNQQIDDRPELTNSLETTQILVQDSITKDTEKMLIRREGYEDLKPTGGHTPNGAAAPSTTNSIGIHELLEFSGTTNKRITMIYHLPHDFIEGTDLFIHIHHAPVAATPSGDVQWKAHYQYSEGYENGVYSGSDLTETITADLTDVSQFTHMITEGVAINDTSLSKTIRTDGIFIITLERLASVDTSTDAEVFFEMDLHYKSDGTKTVNKNDEGSGFTKV